jgi:hypothetical protein
MFFSLFPSNYGHKRKECTSSLFSDSAQSDSSDDESCSVDNDDAQTESVVSNMNQHNHSPSRTRK